MNDRVRTMIAPGALAGIVGGLVFGAAMSKLGVLSTIALLVRARSPVVGFLVHMVVAAIVGAGFGVLVARQRTGAGETVFWGLAYGALWWYLGPLTLLPLLLGRPLDWSVPAAQAQFPSLVGHLLYGLSTAIALVALRRRAPAGDDTIRVTPGSLARGAAAGLAAVWLLGTITDAPQALLAPSATMRHAPRASVVLAVALLALAAGLGYAMLYPRLADGGGATLIRGTAYGFLWWVVGGLTVVPLVEGRGLAWTAADARAGFVSLPACLLFGAALAIGYRWLDRLWRLLFSDGAAVGDEEEGAGARGLRAVGRGALAGVVGGALFTVVMVQLGFLGTVARLVGSTSRVTGFLVHLAISVIIGVSYGLLFRRQSVDAGAALGWGVAYGFFWWVLGGLTLLPLWLGGAPQWTAGGVANAVPSLVGHVAYGAGLGLTFYRLESRHAPWWLSRTEAEAIRIARRQEQLRTSAPALWALVLVIALTVPIILGAAPTAVP